MTDPTPIVFNGQKMPASALALPLATNRAFRYGDGLFESIRVVDGRPHLAKLHWDRLRKGMKFLQLQCPPSWGTRYFNRQIAQLTQGKGRWRIRLSVFRQASGLYTPQSDEASFLIEATPFPSRRFCLNRRGLALGICQSVRLSAQPLSNFKTLNSLPYILAAKECQRKGWDTGLLLNEHGRVAEACSANLFWVQEGVLHSPLVTEGGLDGVFRRHVIDLAASLHLPFKAQAVTPEELLLAEECFLTNSIQGIKWVKKLNNRIFGRTIAPKLLRQVNHLIQ